MDEIHQIELKKKKHIIISNDAENRPDEIQQPFMTKTSNSRKLSQHNKDHT